MLHKKNHGFTLVEISIVIVIIGLIIAGVTAGQTVVKQTQILSITSQLQKYAYSVAVFKSIYNSYPGDMKNAKSYWPSATNGNGNKRIEGSGTPAEAQYAFQHMSLAGIIEGNYSPSATLTINNNVPGGPRTNSLYFFTYATIFGRAGSMVTASSLYAANTPWGAVMTANEAKSIDLKIDDSLADKGLFRTARGLDFSGGGNCVTNDYGSASGSYITSDNAIHCRVFLFID